MTTLLRTAADFDSVPDEALVITIEVVLPEVPHARNRKVWQKFGREFVLLDPGDRDNGEQTKSSGYLENMLTGFGSKRNVPGVGLLLGEFEHARIGADAAKCHVVDAAGNSGAVCFRPEIMHEPPEPVGCRIAHELGQNPAVVARKLGPDRRAG